MSTCSRKDDLVQPVARQLGEVLTTLGTCPKLHQELMAPQEGQQHLHLDQSYHMVGRAQIHLKARLTLGQQLQNPRSRVPVRQCITL